MNCESTNLFPGGLATVDLVLSAPGVNATTNLEVPLPSKQLNATMSVSPVAGPKALSPLLDIGGNGIDWMFNGTGYGRFGQQDQFSDGSTSQALSVSNSAWAKNAVKLPKTARVTRAELNVTAAARGPMSSTDQDTGIDIALGQSAYGNITGIPSDAVGLNSTVQLWGANKVVKDVEQTQNSVSYSVGHPTFSSNQALAQTFKSTRDGTITSVDIYLGGIGGNPGDIYLEIRTTTGSNNLPTSTKIGNSAIKSQNSIATNNWNTFFLGDVDVKANVIYAIIVYAKNSTVQSGNNFFNWYGSNSNSYSDGVIWYYNNLDASGLPIGNETNSDLSFRVYLMTFLSSVDMSKLKVNTIAPSGNDGAGNYFYNFSGPSYAAGRWPFTIKNENTFDVLGLNYTAVTACKQLVNRLAVDVDGDGADDWQRNQPLEGTALVDGLHTVLNDALDASDQSHNPSAPDAYGNPMCTVPMNFSARGNGSATFLALVIVYDYDAPVPDFADELAKYLNGKPNGTVQVPVVGRAESAGTLRLSGLYLNYDAPPVLKSPVPSTYQIPEEGENATLIDLGSYFSDDFPPVTYTRLSSTNETRVEVSINGSHLGARALEVNWTGTSEVRVLATDSRGQATESNVFSIRVAQVNDPPLMTSTPFERAEVNKNYTYQVRAEDAENDTLTFKLDVKPFGMTINMNTGLVSWVPKSGDIGVNNITVNVSDGRLSAAQKFAVSVSTTNNPPAFQSLVNTSALVGKPYFCPVVADDADGDRLVFTLEKAPGGISLNITSDTTALLYWAKPVSGNYTVSVSASDGIAVAWANFTLRVGTNLLPRITSTAPAKAKVGETLTYQVNATDPDGSNLTYAVERGPDGMTISATGLLTWRPREGQKGNQHVVISVSDGMDNQTQEFDVEVSAKPVTEKPFPWLTVLLLIATVVLVATGAYAVVSRKDRRVKERWPEMPKKPEPSPEKAAEKGAAGAMAAVPAVAPAGEAVPASGHPTRVQDMFVIYRDGRLIHHLTNRLSPMDHEIFASMFSSVQDFMKDSMGAQKVDAIKFEEYNILMEKGRNINLAVVISGDEPSDLRQTMKTSIADIELVCARLLDKWDGESAPLKKDLELLLKPITESARTAKTDKKAAVKSPDEYVTILSGVDFYRGFVRVKFAVTNDLDVVITEAAIKVMVKPEALRISSVEPQTFMLEGDTIRLGNVQPSDKLSLNLFLDPLVCVSSMIDATLTFKDAKGELYSIVMSRKRAEVVCPLFATDEEINVAVLRKLISEVQQHDSKVYRIPEGLWAEEAFRMGMSVIEAHNVKLVREFTETKPVYSAEAWYFGKTQIKREQVVMRISVTRESNTLEFFVASSDQMAITGLLAEFGGELNRRLKNKGMIQEPVKHLDLTEKDRVARKSQLLLHRFSEAEAGVEESEPKK